ncbi:hypothetical protein F2981_02560 [Sinorhizobium meliloti]|nr:hypothetical protein [Sinorhizobium meliloti]
MSAPSCRTSGHWTTGMPASWRHRRRKTRYRCWKSSAETGGLAEGSRPNELALLCARSGDQEVFVDLNSPGGDFFEGVAIYNMLRAHPKKVTVRILSPCSIGCVSDRHGG